MNFFKVFVEKLYCFFSKLFYILFCAVVTEIFIKLSKTFINFHFSHKLLHFLSIWQLNFFFNCFLTIVRVKKIVIRPLYYHHSPNSLHVQIRVDVNGSMVERGQGVLNGTVERSIG